MSTEELKYYLHESIEKIDDKNTLQVIKEMVSHLFTENADISITDGQKKRISKAKLQITKGQYTSDNIVREEVREWLEN